jgi:lysophospholipase L1-like esterase
VIGVPSFPAPRLPLHSRLVFLGDSITAGGNGPSFANYALNASGGRYYVPPSGNQGIVGSTTLDFLKRSVTTNGSLATALSLNPKVLHVMGNTNDIGGLSATAADVQGRLRQIYDAALNAGARVVASTITKRIDVNWNADREAVRVAVNTWILAQPDIPPDSIVATIKLAASRSLKVLTVVRARSACNYQRGLNLINAMSVETDAKYK